MPSKHIMRAIAEWRIVGRFASAQIEGAAAIRHEPERFKPAVLMGPVAERLPGRPATCAKKIGFAFDQFDLEWSLLGHDRIISHASFKAPAAQIPTIGNGFDTPRQVRRSAPAGCKSAANCVDRLGRFTR
jgi:hypothetical protein